jgi:hypothetical protein
VLVVALTLCLGLVVALAVVAMGQDEADVDRRPVEDRLFGLRSVVPAD